MGRTSPPAAIIAPPLGKVAKQPKAPSDLPLRHFVTTRPCDIIDDHELPPTPPDSTPGLTELETPVSAVAFERAMPTPSSVTVELDDGECTEDECTEIAPRPIDRGADIIRAFSRGVLSRPDVTQSEIGRPEAPRPDAARLEASRSEVGRSRSRTAYNNTADHSRSASQSTTTRQPRSPVRNAQTTLRRAAGTASAVAFTPGTSVTAKPRSAIRSQSAQGRTPETHTRDPSDASDKSKRVAQASAPVDMAKELLRENTSLQQRVAALQRIERELLAETQDLSRQMAALKKHQEARRQKWREQYRERERGFQTRIQALEERIIQQDEQMMEYKRALPTDETLISDDEIVEWFATRTKAWQDWADEFAHQDPNRLKSGLLPVQTLELCESVKSFIRLYDDGLPEELVNTDSNSGVKAAQVLLHGMLANFIIEETLQSPFWVFDVLSSTSSDMDSPSVVHSNSPIGFRVELSLWSKAAPLRSTRLPQKVPRTTFDIPQSARLPPASVLPRLTLNTSGLSSLPPAQLPRKKDMENLYQLLSNVQHNNREMHAWRAQMIRTLSEGGLCVELENLKGEDRRRLADARKTYARRLKDRFLGGAARFLLNNPEDLAGIERLESRLVKEFDLALQFSCLVWSRQDPLRIKGLQDLSNTAFVGSEGTMELCQTQAPTQAAPVDESKAADMPPGYHDGHPVVMAVQPIIEFVSLVDSKGDREVSKILSKARVLVAAPTTGPQKLPEKSATEKSVKPATEKPVAESPAPEPTPEAEPDKPSGRSSPGSMRSVAPSLLSPVIEDPNENSRRHSKDLKRNTISSQKARKPFSPPPPRSHGHGEVLTKRSYSNGNKSDLFA
ncbi:hypothetical protein QBC34DRAFT_77507 [Podospora aff. communis PSN243]|uniref:Uncharacterized protein n=1 Tax=Podospora aff. communis PSN243 TaxID=3040156 RepID=A0AAV9GPF7_9PEZI|nr:hypothetical protein QBC34DRAFT_77507 [Podospora aff. communis PSN243]